MAYFYGFLLAFLVTLLGFWPSFFSNPAQNDPAHVIHGVFATGWMGILMLQAWLMAKGRVRLHHGIGRASVVWVIGLVLTAINMVHIMIANRGAHALPMDLRLTLGFIDLMSLILFTGFYAAAVVCAFRRDIWHHKRWMVATVIVALVPAVGRIFAIYVPGIQGLSGALPPAFYSIAAVLMGLITWDQWREKRLSMPYILCLGGLGGIQSVMFMAPHITAFIALARTMGYPG